MFLIDRSRRGWGRWLRESSNSAEQGPRQNSEAQWWSGGKICLSLWKNFLVIFFATDEINKNPYLLPIMTLIFSIVFGQCEDTLRVLDFIHSMQIKQSVAFINYNFGERICDVGLSGPSWKTTLKLVINSRSPNVRMCGTE